MKIYAIVCLAALMAADAVCARLEGSNVSCRKAKMKLQQCFNENGKKDPKWKKSMIKAMKTKEHCESNAKTMPEKVKCGKEAVKVLEIKCEKDTKRLLHGVCMKGGPKKPPPSLECLHMDLVVVLVWQCFDVDLVVG